MRQAIQSSILNSVWMIHRPWVDSIMPRIIRMAQGEDVTFYSENHHPIPAAYFTSEDGGMDHVVMDQAVTRGGYYSLKAIEMDSVFVIPVRGALTKSDQLCGPMGTESLMRLLQDADRHPMVKAIVLDMDTPGGQASNLESVAEVISNLKTPIITFYNSLCCSAGYYLASATDEIFASEETDLVGSIGTMITIADYKAYFESQGLPMHEINADQSTDKNKMFLAALAKDYKPIRVGLLNPYAQSFIDRVQSERPQVNQKVFTGATYMSTEAISLGLIDGIKSYEQVIEHAWQLGAASNSSGDQNTQSNMKLKMVLSVLGYSALEATEGKVSLSVEDTQKLNASIVAADHRNQRISSGITGVLGLTEISVEDNTATFTVEQMQKIESYLATAEETAPAGDPEPESDDEGGEEGEEETPGDGGGSASEEAAAEDAVTLESISAQISGLSSKIESNSSDIGKIKGVLNMKDASKPAAANTTTETVDSEHESEPWNNEKDPINKWADEVMGVE